MQQWMPWVQLTLPPINKTKPNTVQSSKRLNSIPAIVGQFHTLLAINTEYTGILASLITQRLILRSLKSGKRLTRVYSLIFLLLAITSTLTSTENTTLNLQLMEQPPYFTQMAPLLQLHQMQGSQEWIISTTPRKRLTSWLTELLLLQGISNHRLLYAETTKLIGARLMSLLLPIVLVLNYFGVILRLGLLLRTQTERFQRREKMF